MIDSRTFIELHQMDDLIAGSIACVYVEFGHFPIWCIIEEVAQNTLGSEKLRQFSEYFSHITLVIKHIIETEILRETFITYLSKKCVPLW